MLRNIYIYIYIGINGTVMKGMYGCIHIYTYYPWLYIVHKKSEIHKGTFAHVAFSGKPQE